MKRKIFTSLLLIVMLVLMSSCSLIFGSKKPTMISVVVDYGNDEETLEFKANEKNKFTPKYIKGKVLVGFYGQDTATGQEYADYKGNTVSWMLNKMPDKIYAVYEDVDYSATYVSNVYFYEDPHEYRFYYFGKYAKCTITLNFGSTELYRILYSNPDFDIIVNVDAEVKYQGTHDPKTRLNLSMGEESLETKEIGFSHSGYDSISIGTTLKGARLVADNAKLTVGFALTSNYIDDTALYKNLKISFKIAQNKVAMDND